MTAVAHAYEDKRLRLIAMEAGDGRILDIGHAQCPNTYLDGAGSTGFDLNVAENCDYAEQIAGDIREIKSILHGREFDCVIAAEFIEHVENPYAVLRDLRALIAPGGRLILSTPNPVAFPTLLCEWTMSRKFFYTTDHTYYFSPRWMTRVLEGCGYNVEKIRGVGLWPFGFIPAPAGWSYQVMYVASPQAASESSAALAST